LEVRNWRLEIGSWRLEIGDWKLKIGDWRLEIGSWRLEVGDWRFVGCWGLDIRKIKKSLKIGILNYLLNSNVRYFKKCLSFLDQCLIRNSKPNLESPNSKFQSPTSNFQSLVQTVIKVLDSPDVGNHLDVLEFFDVDAHFALLIRRSKFLFHS
jgi:hypothetical protein